MQCILKVKSASPHINILTFASHFIAWQSVQVIVPAMAMGTNFGAIYAIHGLKVPLSRPADRARGRFLPHSGLLCSSSFGQ
jgi:hypothetical protein